MGLITLHTIDAKEALALAHYRKSQHAKLRADSADTASPPSAAPSPARPAQRYPVNRALPRASGLPSGPSNAQPTSVTYTVQHGDTLRGIADWFYGDRSRWRALYAANRSRISDPQKLAPGTVLRIPRYGGATPLA